MIVGHHLFHDIGTGTGDDARVKVTGVHIDNTAVRVAQVIHQSGQRLPGGDRQSLTVCFDGIDHGIRGSTVMHFEKVFKTLLHGLAVHVTAAGKLHTIAQGDRPGQAAIVFPGRRQPWFQFHVVRVAHQGFTDAIPDAGPAIVCPVRIDGLFPVLRVKGGVSDDHGLIFCIDRNGKHHRENEYQCQHVFHGFSSSLQPLLLQLPDLLTSCGASCSVSSQVYRYNMLSIRFLV